MVRMASCPNWRHLGEWHPVGMATMIHRARFKFEDYDRFRRRSQASLRAPKKKNQRVGLSLAEYISKLSPMSAFCDFMRLGERRHWVLSSSMCSTHQFDVMARACLFSLSLC